MSKVKQYNNQASEYDLIIKAEKMAHEYHDGQKYGNNDYTYHLQQVVSTLDTLFNENNKDCVKYNPVYFFRCIQAAWLHDMLEDTDATVEDLEQGWFSDEVIQAVKLVTKTKGYDYDTYISDIINGSGMAVMVKLADTIANLSFSYITGDKRRIEKYRKQYELLYEASKPPEVTIEYAED